MTLAKEFENCGHSVYLHLYTSILQLQTFKAFSLKAFVLSYKLSYKHSIHTIFSFNGAHWAWTSVAWEDWKDTEFGTMMQNIINNHSVCNLCKSWSRRRLKRHGIQNKDAKKRTFGRGWNEGGGGGGGDTQHCIDQHIIDQVSTCCLTSCGHASSGTTQSSIASARYDHWSWNLCIYVLAGVA